MKILVLQLARFGDIYQTWPCLSALRRKYPQAQIHLAVRERYEAATDQIDSIDKVIALPTKSILAPLIFSEEGIENSLIEMDRYISLFDQAYDEIINLSFSPFSSYLVDELKTEKSLVKGYDRFSDGYLKIEDDASAYFYAQVGVGRTNRLHLVDLFAMVAGVELLPEDCHIQKPFRVRNDQPYVVIHVGASKSFKTCRQETWQSILRVLLRRTNATLYLVGTYEERLHADWIETQNRIVDLCGETSLQDLFPLVQGADALIAGDSMLVQIANLTQTKTLNLSFSTVNFWETGPRTPGSRVLYFESIDDVEAREVVDQLQALNTDGPLPENSYLCAPKNHIQYQYTKARADEFQWAFIRAMYMGFDYPITENMETAIAMTRMHELADLGIENVQAISRDPNNVVSLGIIDEIDLLMNEIGRRNEDSAPLVRWFLTEKSRIGPGKFDKILEGTLSVFEQLKVVTNMYLTEDELASLKVEREDLTWK